MSTTLQTIQAALNDAMGKETEISAENHLIHDDILDSLDSAVFLLNLETATGKKLPENDVEEKDLFQVQKLIDYLET